MQPPLALGVFILAAGASSRMGQPKLLLPWGPQTILGHLLDQWRRVGAGQIAVVVAPGQVALAAELDRLAFPVSHRIANPQPALGMFSSIQCAARWTGWQPSITHIAMALGDQPHLRDDTLRALVDWSRSQPDRICQPFFHSKTRHPILFPRPRFLELALAVEDRLSRFLKNRSDVLSSCEIEDSGLDFDIDRPEDYEKAARLYLSWNL